jgi:hypothetical protein
LSTDDDMPGTNPERRVVSEPLPGSGGADDLNGLARKFEAWLESLFAIAGLIVVIGVIAGIIIAFHAKAVPCEDGTTDVQCHAHPHAVVGGALIGASLFAALLLAIIGVSAKLIVAEMGSRQSLSEPASVADEGVGTTTDI